MLAVDAAGHPDPAAARVAGYDIIAQYLGGAYAMPPTYPAAVTNAEVGLVSTWEVAADAALGGAPAGTADGERALSAAQGYGQPQGTAIYCTVDFAPLPAQLPPVTEYVSAFATVVRTGGYLAGCYGGTETLNAVRGSVDRTWQSAGWTNGVALPWVSLRQDIAQAIIGGVTCDVDLVLSDPGAWNLAGPYPARKPFTPIVTNYPEDAMQSITTEVQILGGHGWIPSPVPAAQVINVVVADENPGAVERYDELPTFVGAATQATAGAPNGALVFAGPSTMNGTYGVTVWAA
jgi:hypothetical protein